MRWNFFIVFGFSEAVEIAGNEKVVEIMDKFGFGSRNLEVKLSSVSEVCHLF